MTDMQSSKGRLVVHALLALYAIILAYIVGGLIFKYSVAVDLFFGLSFALLFFAAAQAIYEMGLTRTVVFFVITSAVGFFAEVLGTSSGFPFGKYTYGTYLGSSYLGPEILGVPEVVPLIWFVIVYICFSQTYSRDPTKSSFSRLLPAIALTAFGVMAWDVIVDPMFTSYGYWIWSPDNPGPKIYGVPLTNFVGWFAVSFLMLALVFLAFKTGKKQQVIKRRNVIDSRIVYILLMIDGAVANASLGNYLAIVFGVISMTAFFVASIALSSKDASERVQDKKTAEQMA
jgi:uncharacterized membrane protein